MSTVHFTSALDPSYRSRLEELLFFNANQSTTGPQVIAVIERYGAPRVVVDGEKLRVLCGGSLCPQTLYAVETSETSQALVGVVIFTREEETLVVLHIAVREDYTQRSQPGRRPLVLEMLEEVRGIGRRIKGVSSIAVFPYTAQEARLPVSRERRG